MITIHEQKSTDFTTLGLGALAPSECIVEEEAGGIYELTLAQPMTKDARHKRIAPFRIIKAPAPVRETPLIDLSQIGTTSRDIYKVTTDGRRLYLRVAPDQEAKGIKTYAPGTEVVSLALSDDGDWRQVAILDGGATGWMFAGNLLYVRTETVTGGSSIVEPRQTREQLFRVYRVLPDTKLRRVKVHAQHISYDLRGAIVVGEYKPEKVPANEVCAEIMARADHDVSGFNLYCTVTAPVSGDFGGRNIINCLLDAESGIAAQTGAMVVRDNYDIFVMPMQERGQGVELRYGKNLLSAELDTSSTDIVTRIRPVGRNSNGDKLYLPENNGFVDSLRMNDYPVPYAREIEYDVVVGSALSETDALEQLRSKAKADLANYEKLSVALDADFVRLDLTEKYRHLANSYALHLYDRVSVIDRDAGIDVTVAMCRYKFDALLEQYADTELNDVSVPSSEEEIIETTVSYKMLHSDSYRGSWSWTADNDIRQGYTGGRIRGCMWFDNDLIRADLAGKTIRQASLRLYAMTGVGRGVAVTAELYGTNKEYEGRSGAPALTASYGVIGSFEPGEVTTITIPTQVIDDLVSGVINGLMLYSSDTELYSGRDYSRNYARFAGETSADEETVPVLTVTTEGSQDASEVNQIPISTDTDGSIYNGVGYKTKTRINSSGVPVDVYNPNAVNAVFATGFIPVGSGDVMRLKGCYIAIEDFGGGDIASDDTCSYGQSLWGTRIGLYDSDKKLTAVCSWGSLHDGEVDVLTSYSAVGGKITQFAVAAEGAAYIRLSLAAEGDAADAVVTMTAGGSAGIGDDGSGNAVISGAVLADDGAGNVTLSGAVLTDDGNGNVRMQ